MTLTTFHFHSTPTGKPNVMTLNAIDVAARYFVYKLYEATDGQPMQWATLRGMDESRATAFLYDRGCVPPYTIAMIEFDEPPWDRFLDKPWGRFICPGCGQTLDIHVSHGPGTPGTERFNEVA